MDKKTYKKILKIILDAFIIIVAILAFFILIISIVSKKDDDGTASIFGYQMRFVLSDSMGECDLTDVSNYEIKSIPIKSCVIIEEVPKENQEEWYSNLKVGDVLTFKYVYTKQETITHRIVNIKEKETGGYIITLEGDNKLSDSSLLTQEIDTSLDNSYNYVIGKVVGVNYILGLLIYALKNPIGIVLIIIIPCVIIIIFEVIKLTKLLGKTKQNSLEEKLLMQASEIEELRKKLENIDNVQDNKDNKNE